MCANTARADSSCGDSFFYKSNKGRCLCEKIGATCQREADALIDEYILGNGLQITEISQRNKLSLFDDLAKIFMHIQLIFSCTCPVLATTTNTVASTTTQGIVSDDFTVYNSTYREKIFWKYYSVGSLQFSDIVLKISFVRRDMRIYGPTPLIAI